MVKEGEGKVKVSAFSFTNLVYLKSSTYALKVKGEGKNNQT
jgi:hypothetical protein